MNKTSFNVNKDNLTLVEAKRNETKQVNKDQGQQRPAEENMYNKQTRSKEAKASRGPMIEVRVEELELPRFFDLSFMMNM